MNSIHDYSDIINLPRPEPKYHVRMPLSDRAAQFAPFAALTGFYDVIEETGRTTDSQILLDDLEKEKLNKKLTRLRNEINLHPEVNIRYFVPDKKKNGGSYKDYSGSVRKIDPYESCILLTSGVKIKFDDIINIEILRK